MDLESVLGWTYKITRDGPRNVLGWTWKRDGATNYPTSLWAIPTTVPGIGASCTNSHNNQE
eukprot:8639909-Karenia_brevis.AAC.1